MPGHDVIVVGFSAGGVEAMARLAAGLPPDLPAAVLVVHHFPGNCVSVLPSILSRSSGLPAAHCTDNQIIAPGRIYVAPPDKHMVVSGNRIHLTRGPRENGHRPAIDPLFRTAARTYGARVVAVLLSGALDDGTVGMMAVKEHGGVAVVQDPEEALYSGIPDSAIQRVDVDHILPIQKIAELLTRLARGPVPRSAAPEEGTEPMLPEEQHSQDPAEAGTAAIAEGALPGPPTALTCPECGGAIWESVSGHLVRYRCHVGHAYTADSMVGAQAAVVETALWTAVRALEEKAELSRRLADRSRKRGLERLTARYEAAVDRAQRGSDAIRQLLLSGTAEPAVGSNGGDALDQSSLAASTIGEGR